MGYLPEIARRLHHARDLGEPFDFLTWFEFRAEDEGRFDELVARLRATEEWRYVEREVDVRLARAGARIMIGLAALVILLAASPPAGDAHRGPVVGVAMGGAAAFGSASRGTGGGASARVMAGYEIVSGFTPTVAIQWTRFEASAGSTWEIAALPGLRWYGGLAGRLRSWGEVAAGVGQFVYENDSLNTRLEAGLRLRAAGGLDFAVDPLVSVGLQVALNDQHAELSADYHWVDVDCGVTFLF